MTKKDQLNMEPAQLHSLLDELEELARLQNEPPKFHAALLHWLVQTSRPKALAIWVVEQERYRLDSEAGLLALGLESDQGLQQLHEEGLAALFNSSDSSPSLPWSLKHGQRNLATEDTQHTFQFWTSDYKDPGQRSLVLEVVTERGQSSAIDLHESLSATAAKLLNDHQSRFRLAALERENQVTRGLLPLVERIYAQPSLLKTAYEIANEGRAYLECERLSVLQLRKRRAQLLAISGIDKVHDAAQPLRLLTDLAQAVALTGRAFEYRAGMKHETAMPQLESLLQRYLDATPCHCLLIQPLHARDQASTDDKQPGAKWAGHARTNSSYDDDRDATCIGALVLENIAESHPLNRQRLLPFSQHASRAMSLAADLEETPLLRLGRKLKRWQSRRSVYLSRTFVIAAIVMLAIVGSLLIPAELIIQAKGRYYPSALQHIYAPLDGEVIEIKEAQQAVSVGDKLVEMRSRAWELKKEEILTQRGVTLEKLRGVESARLNVRRSTSQDSGAVSASAQAAELSATERELRELLTSQDQQLVIVQKMLDSLTITSPIAGRIVSWNPLDSWEHRPIQQGQKLLSLAADDGAGWLHLRVLDSDVRHLVSNNSNQSGQMPITFSIASDPGERFTATATELGSIIESLPGEPPSVKLTALVKDSDKLNARHGATVQARIHCGQRSLAYVWTRRLWDAMLMYW